MSENRTNYFCSGKSIALRNLEETDIDDNYGYWLNDELVCQYNSHHRFPVSKRELVEYVQTCNTVKNCVVMAIEHIEERIHIGNASLQEIDYIDSSAEIAVLLGEKEYWSKGYAYEAMLLLIKHAFYELNLNRVYYGTSEDNLGMQKLAEKIGFQKEGRRRKALYKHGKYKDILEYGILKEEFITNDIN